MNRTKRVAAIGLLCIGTSTLSFGESFDPIDSSDWNVTYNDANTALFSAVIQQGADSLSSGLPTGPGVTGAPAFGNGTLQAFTLMYDPTNDGATSLIIGSTELDFQTLTVAPAGGGLDHIGLALGVGSDEDTITISNLALNGVATTNDPLVSAGTGYFDFAMAPTTDLSGAPLTITGDITMSWTDATPQLSAEIVGADAARATPEPGTWALFGSALAGLGLLRRKRIV